jgi:hypothetical protein
MLLYLFTLLFMEIFEHLQERGTVDAILNVA